MAMLSPNPHDVFTNLIIISGSSPPPSGFQVTTGESGRAGMALMLIFTTQIFIICNTQSIFI